MKALLISADGLSKMIDIDRVRPDIVLPLYQRTPFDYSGMLPFDRDVGLKTRRYVYENYIGVAFHERIYVYKEAL